MCICYLFRTHFDAKDFGFRLRPPETELSFSFEGQVVIFSPSVACVLYCQVKFLLPLINQTLVYLLCCV